MSLTAILVTHRHADHIGGVEQLLKHRQVPVYAPKNDQLDFPYLGVTEGDHVALPELDVDLTVIDVPGHMAKHVAYYGGNSLFCGDTLFGCGCGRVFDGTCDQLFESLLKLAALPSETEVYCAHEYTLANIEFALAIDPENQALSERKRVDKARMNAGIPTLPSTIGIEKTTNPFLRCNTSAIKQAAFNYDNSALDARAVFCAIRTIKNTY